MSLASMNSCREILPRKKAPGSIWKVEDDYPLLTIGLNRE